MRTVHITVPQKSLKTNCRNQQQDGFFRKIKLISGNIEQKTNQENYAQNSNNCC